MIYQNILETIGNTPIVKIQNLKTPANLFVKIESFNPGASVKDRAAFNMIQQAEKRGDLKPGQTIIEPTSGNTGIGLAMVAAAKGYPLILTMPATSTIERQKIMKAYGAEVILVSGGIGMANSIAKATKLSKEKNYFMPMQFENFDNLEAHQATAREIWEDFGLDLDALICSTGTSGTISGTGKHLRKKNPNLKIFATEPLDSPVLSGGKAGAHKIPGMGPGFIPPITQMELFDSIVQISTESAYQMTHWLVKKEGIFGGVSSGAVLAGMVEIAHRPELEGKTILGILPDTGERYLSSEVWDTETNLSFD